MKHLFLIAGILLQLLLSTTKAGQAAIPNLSAAQRAAVVKEANQAVNQYLHADAADRGSPRIPDRFCGAALLGLKPLRIVFDRVNLKIIFVDTEDQEAGLYVSIPVSSYAPPRKEFAEFVELSRREDRTFGTLYRYRITKKITSDRSH